MADAQIYSTQQLKELLERPERATGQRIVRWFTEGRISGATQRKKGAKLWFDANGVHEVWRLVAAFEGCDPVVDMPAAIRDLQPLGRPLEASGENPTEASKQTPEGTPTINIQIPRDFNISITLPELSAIPEAVAAVMKMPAMRVLAEQLSAVNQAVAQMPILLHTSREAARAFGAYSRTVQKTLPLHDVEFSPALAARIQQSLSVSIPSVLEQDLSAHLRGIEQETLADLNRHFASLDEPLAAAAANCNVQWATSAAVEAVGTRFAELADSWAAPGIGAELSRLVNDDVLMKEVGEHLRLLSAAGSLDLLSSQLDALAKVGGWTSDFGELGEEVAQLADPMPGDATAEKARLVQLAGLMVLILVSNPSVRGAMGTMVGDSVTATRLLIALVGHLDQVSAEFHGASLMATIMLALEAIRRSR